MNITHNYYHDWVIHKTFHIKTYNAAYKLQVSNYEGSLPHTLLLMQLRPRYILNYVLIDSHYKDLVDINLHISII